MIDFLVFLFTQFSNIILILDDIIIFGNLSLLKFFLILLIFIFVFRIFLYKKSNK